MCKEVFRQLVHTLPFLANLHRNMEANIQTNIHIQRHANTNTDANRLQEGCVKQARVVSKMEREYLSAKKMQVVMETIVCRVRQQCFCDADSGGDTLNMRHLFTTNIISSRNIQEIHIKYAVYRAS